MVPTPESFDDWERRSWEERADAYAAGLVGMTAGSVEAVLDAVGAAPGVRLLDVGCGPGVVSAVAAGRGCEVVGVDVAASMLTLAQDRVPTAEFRLGSALELPAADATFDAVCGNFVLPHVDDPQVALAEALRVTRPGGTIAFTEWNPVEHRALGVFWDLLAADGMPLPPDAPARHGTALTGHSVMHDALVAAGATDVQVLDARWTISVDPDDWWAAVLAATPRTGAAIGAVDAERRTALLTRYREEMRAFPRSGVGVAMPCAAIIGVGRRA